MAAHYLVIKPFLFSMSTRFMRCVPQPSLQPHSHHLLLADSIPFTLIFFAISSKCHLVCTPGTLYRCPHLEHCAFGWWDGFLPPMMFFPNNVTPSIGPPWPVLNSPPLVFTCLIFLPIPMSTWHYRIYIHLLIVCLPCWSNKSMRAMTFAFVFLTLLSPRP